MENGSQQSEEDGESNRNGENLVQSNNINIT
jgi:hypothetical protein